jgi:hypothetical protein
MPPEMQITTAIKARWRGVRLETGITPLGVKLTPPGMPITTGAKLGGVKDRGYRVD